MSRLAAAAPIQTDTYSTSSSTLVNHDHDTDEAAAAKKAQKAQKRVVAAGHETRSSAIQRARLIPEHRSIGSSIRLQRGRDASLGATHAPSVSSGMLAASTVMPSGIANRNRKAAAPKIQFPDDHRCSEYETDGGPCPCVLEGDSSGGSSGRSSVASTSAVRLEAEPEQAERFPLSSTQAKTIPGLLDHNGDGDDEAEYIRKIVTARRRKMLQESSISLTPQAPGAFSQKWKELSRPHDYTAGNDIAQRHIDTARGIRQSVESNGMQLPPDTSTPQRRMPGQSSPAQSAARKSISNVFERLLREEEQRREEERKRKEMARTRRREEKRRRDDESSLLSLSRATLSSPVVKSDAVNAQVRAVAEAGDSKALQKGTREGSEVEIAASSPLRASRQSEKEGRLAVALTADKPTTRNGISVELAENSQNGVTPTHIKDTDMSEDHEHQRRASMEDSTKAQTPLLKAGTSTPSFSASLSRTMRSPFLPGTYRSPIVKPSGETLAESRRGLIAPTVRVSAQNRDEVDVPKGLTIGHAPRASTPPLINVPKEQKRPTSTSVDTGNDSIRITVHDLMDALQRAKSEPDPLKELNRNTLADADADSGNRNSQAVALRSETQHEEEEHQARLASVRSRIVQLARELNIDESSSVPTIPVKSRKRITWTFVAWCFVLQSMLVYFMLVAAQAEAEHMFLTVHRDAWSDATAGSSIMPSLSVTSLFGPLLLKARLLPDHSGLVDQQTIPVAAVAGHSWGAVTRMALATLRQPHHRGMALRLVCSKLIASLGISEGDVIIMGHRVPT